MRPSALRCAVLPLLLVAAAQAQNASVSPCPTGEAHNFWFGSKPHACELRSFVLPMTGNEVKVVGVNGGITLVGEDRRDIALEVRVNASGASQSEAQARLQAIRILTQGTIQAQGPNGGEHDGSDWSASFKLRVPRQIMANLHSENGGISVADVEGAVTAETHNGGLSLYGVAGTVHATTVNGGISVALAGDRDHGDGITARTENGGISLRVPERFAAHLVVSTVNGGVSVGLPGGVHGGNGKRIEQDLNGGGPTVQLETTNGGISLARL